MLLLVFTYSTVSLIRVQGPFSVNKSPIAIQGSNISNYIFISSAWYMTHTKVCIFPIYISGICFRPRVHPLTLSPLFWTKSPPLDIEPTVLDQESTPWHWAHCFGQRVPSPPGYRAPFYGQRVPTRVLSQAHCFGQRVPTVHRRDLERHNLEQHKLERHNLERHNLERHSLECDII